MPPHVHLSFTVNAVVKLHRCSLTASCSSELVLQQLFAKNSKQLKVNHKHPYHVIKNNAQAKIG